MKKEILLKICFIIFLGVFGLCSIPYADTVHLANGNVFDGDVIKETDKEVQIYVDGGIVTFSPNEIKSIDRVSEVPLTQEEVDKKIKHDKTVRSIKEKWNKFSDGFKERWNKINPFPKKEKKLSNKPTMIQQTRLNMHKSVEHAKEVQKKASRQ